MIKNILTASAFAALTVAIVCLAGCTQPSDTGSGNLNTPSRAANATAGDTPSSAGTPAIAVDSNSQPAPGSNTAWTNTAVATSHPATERNLRMPQAQVGSGGNDLFLFTQARAAVNSDDELKNAAITIDVKEGVATLAGAVTNDGQRQKAERLVKGVQGIKSVDDHLRVSAGGSK